MSAADIARFFVIFGVGVLAFITFLVAGTIVGLMVVDGDRCRQCLNYPVGLWILGLLAIFFLLSMAQEWRNHRQEFLDWFAKNRTAVIVGIIILVVFISIFSWSRAEKQKMRKQCKEYHYSLTLPCD